MSWINLAVSSLKDNLEIGNLVLGTAQFGLNYGVTNDSGKVNVRRAADILSKCYEVGIRTIDTAVMYGNAQEVLGDIGVTGFNVDTKLPSLTSGSVSGSKCARTFLEQSLKSLKIDRINTLYFHDVEDLVSFEVDEILYELNKLRNEGLFQKIGVSLYDLETYKLILAKHLIEVVQVQCNPFDRAHRACQHHDFLEEKNISFVYRSIFLQGVLVQSAAKRPKHFSNWKHVFDAWDTFVEDKFENGLHACASFIKNTVRPGDKVIFGVTAVSELMEILSAFEKPAMKIDFSHPDLVDDLYDPRKWPLPT